MKTTTRFEVEKTYNVDSESITLKYINGRHFYGRAKNQYEVRNQLGSIMDMGTDQESLKFSMYTTREQSLYTEDFCRAKVDEWALQDEKRLQADIDSKARAKEQVEKSQAISAKFNEARKIRSEAFTELNKIVCSASDFAAVQKNKKAVELVNLINFIDVYSTFNFSHQFLKTQE
jgi:hypothetical protein